MKKTVIILRAVPGSGKSFFADYIKTLDNDTVICCADDYFMVDGKYIFDFALLYKAHKSCQNKFNEALENNVNNIVISNTNTTNKDVNYYRNRAIKAGYTVFVLVLENRHDGKDSHNVSDDVKNIMRESLLKSIKL